MEWLAGIGGIAGAIGGFLNNNNSIDAAWQMMLAQQQFNAEQAKINRDWQEDMRETSYQTAMADMKKGGLNPLLVGNIGGAAMPGSSQASAGGGNQPQLQNFVAQGVSTAMQLLQTLNNAELVEAQANKTKAEERLVNEQVLNQAPTRENIVASTKRAEGDTRSPEDRAALTAEEIFARHAGGVASLSAAGASAASANLDAARAANARIEAEHYRKYSSWPAQEQGYRGFGVGTPPPSQMLPNQGTAADQAWKYGQVYSGRSLAEQGLDAASNGISGLKNAITHELGRMMQHLRRRSVDQNGTDPYSSPSPFGAY